MYNNFSYLAYVEIVDNTTYRECRSNGRICTFSCTEEQMQEKVKGFRSLNWQELKLGEILYFAESSTCELYGWPYELIRKNAELNLSKQFDKDIERWAKNIAVNGFGFDVSPEYEGYIRENQNLISIGIRACLEKYNIDIQKD